MKSIFFGSKSEIQRVYTETVVSALKASAGIIDGIYTINDLSGNNFSGVEYIFSTWGMPHIAEEQIARFFPSVKAVFYAAGSVQHFAMPFINRGAKVFSAWAANAVPVAEFTAAQILLANKNYFTASRYYGGGYKQETGCAISGITGNYNTKAGIIGAGMIGSKVIEILHKITDLQILVFDPYLPDKRAAELNVQKVSLEEIFTECQTVSNHLANNAQTKGMLGYELFCRMKPYATFINTGRGAQVIESDLIRILRERPDLSALLDVTDPEPPVLGSALYELPNVILSPHIAGSTGGEVCRMAEYMLEEFRLYTSGLPTRFEVTREMLATMA